jgi:hypothetical protein
MKVIDYSNTIMYKLVPKNLDLEYIYIGHTTNFRNRKNLHKNACININNKSYNFKVYKMIRDNGGWYEWDMIEIEKYPCADGNEARKRERELMELNKCNLNSNKAFLTPEELTIYKVQYDKEYKPIYYLNNKTYMRAQQKEYYNLNKNTLNTKRKEKRQQKKLASLNLEN